MWLLRSLLIVSMALFPTGSLRGDTFQVTKTADTNDGTCDLDCSLREAIDAANTNPGADDVPVPAGNYLLTLGQLTVSDGVSIAGADQTNTIIDGNAADRVFDILSGTTVTISDLTIQNGDAGSANGGGVQNALGGTLTLNNSTVAGNAALRGGGVVNRGAMTLNNTTVSGNSTSAGSFGGGVFNYGGGTMTLNNTTVSGNVAVRGLAYYPYYPIYYYGGKGGGVFNFSGTMTLNNTTVSGNIAGYSGGGVFNSASTLELNNTTISGNSAWS